MEIGTLNQRITLLEQRVKVDAIGNHCNQWEEAFSCWARVTLKSSVENADTGVTKEVQTLDFLYPAAAAMDAVHICEPDFVSGGGL